MSPVTDPRRKEKQATTDSAMSPVTSFKRKRGQCYPQAVSPRTSTNKRPRNHQAAASVVPSSLQPDADAPKDTSESTTKKRPERNMNRFLPSIKVQIEEFRRRMQSSPKEIVFPPGFVPFGGISKEDYAALKPYCLGSLGKREEKDVTYEFGKKAASRSGGKIVKAECMDPHVIMAAHEAIIRHNMTKAGKEMRLSLAAILRVNSESLRPELAGSYYYITLVANDVHLVMCKFEAKVFYGVGHYIKLFRPALEPITPKEIEKGKTMRFKMGPRKTNGT